jgi:hypothetical protein
LFDQPLTVLYKIHTLGLNQKPVSLKPLLDSISEDDMADLYTNGIKIVMRKRRDSPIKPRTVLADSEGYDGDAIVNASTGFYVVVPDESVIFVSFTSEGKFNMLFFV